VKILRYTLKNLWTYRDPKWASMVMVLNFKSRKSYANVRVD